ncbi:hypothetical protein Bca52824_094127 [Brassica carinata]|uniref:Uncharacterized protein n=1 Tax=Brassica carinata TaxID=52824 RepID=A0A8X7TJJ0_BRACI|nr:hypothetical protein Bca52824_094127 [Brassica carinata]
MSWHYSSTLLFLLLCFSAAYPLPATDYFNCFYHPTPSLYSPSNPTRAQERNEGDSSIFIIIPKLGLRVRIWGFFDLCSSNHDVVSYLRVIVPSGMDSKPVIENGVVEDSDEDKPIVFKRTSGVVSNSNQSKSNTQEAMQCLLPRCDERSMAC